MTGYFNHCSQSVWRLNIILLVGLLLFSNLLFCQTDDLKRNSCSLGLGSNLNNASSYYLYSHFGYKRKLAGNKPLFFSSNILLGTRKSDYTFQLPNDYSFRSTRYAFSAGLEYLPKILPVLSAGVGLNIASIHYRGKLITNQSRIKETLVNRVYRNSIGLLVSFHTQYPLTLNNALYTRIQLVSPDNDNIQKAILTIGYQQMF